MNKCKGKVCKKKIPKKNTKKGTKKNTQKAADKLTLQKAKETYITKYDINDFKDLSNNKKKLSDIEIPSTKLSTKDMKLVNNINKKLNICKNKDPMKTLTQFQKNLNYDFDFNYKILDLINYIINIYPNYNLECLLGAGDYGIVFNIKDKNYPYNEYALKIQLITTSDFFREIEMLKTFSQKKIAPGLIDFKVIQFYDFYFGIIIMEKIETDLESLLRYSLSLDILNSIYKQILYLIKTMCASNIVHGDMHDGNIGIIINSNEFKVVLIDFGKSCCVLSKTKCNPKAELDQLLRSLIVFNKKGNKINLQFLISKFYNFYKSDYFGDYPYLPDSFDINKNRHIFDEVYDSDLLEVYNYRKKILNKEQNNFVKKYPELKDFL